MHVGLEIKLPTPTADTSELVKIGRWILRHTFRSGYRYIKVGVDLRVIRSNDQVQQSLFDSNALHRERMSKLFEAVDLINTRRGRETVRLASSGYEQKWTMKQDFRSLAFTTRLQDVIRVVAK